MRLKRKTSKVQPAVFLSKTGKASVTPLVLQISMSTHYQVGRKNICDYLFYLGSDMNMTTFVIAILLCPHGPFHLAEWKALLVCYSWTRHIPKIWFFLLKCVDVRRQRSRFCDTYILQHSTIHTWLRASEYSLYTVRVRSCPKNAVYMANIVRLLQTLWFPRNLYYSNRNQRLWMFVRVSPLVLNSWSLTGREHPYLPLSKPAGRLTAYHAHWFVYKDNVPPLLIYNSLIQTFVIFFKHFIYPLYCFS